MRGDSAAYGYELVLDLHGCDPTTFSRSSLDDFFTELCELIDMRRCEVHFWDDVGVRPEERQTLGPHRRGAQGQGGGRRRPGKSAPDAFIIILLIPRIYDERNVKLYPNNRHPLRA